MRKGSPLRSSGHFHMPGQRPTRTLTHSTADVDTTTEPPFDGSWGYPKRDASPRLTCGNVATSPREPTPLLALPPGLPPCAGSKQGYRTFRIHTATQDMAVGVTEKKAGDGRESPVALAICWAPARPPTASVGGNMRGRTLLALDSGAVVSSKSHGKVGRRR